MGRTYFFYLVFFALFLIANTTGVVMAASYQVNLADLQGGYYYCDYASNPRTVSFDFGTTFSSINSATVVWSGYTAPSIMPDPMNPPGIMMMPSFEASLQDQSSNTYAWAYMGSGTSPSTFVGNLSQLSEGRGQLMLECNIIPGSPTGFGQVYDFSLVIDGAAGPVPEPSGFLALGGGLVALAGIARRR